MSEELSEVTPEVLPEDQDFWKYGDLYWGIIVQGIDDLKYLVADSVEVTAHGDLIFTGKRGPLLVIAAGKWHMVWAASMPDGRAVAVREPVAKEKAMT